MSSNSNFYSDIELQQLGFKNLGFNVKISKLASIHSPQTISIGNNVRIDNFCHLVGGEKGIEIGNQVHIASFSIINGFGGIKIKDFVTLASRVSLYSSSDSYSGDSLTHPFAPIELRNNIIGEIFLDEHVIIGSSSTIMPGVRIAKGVAIGAYSFVKKNLDDPFTIYYGIPARKLRKRSEDLIYLAKKWIVD